MAGQTGTFAQRAIEYAEQVTAGDIAACHQIRLACQRFLEEVRGGTWIFNPNLVERVCRFTEALPHTKGQWASRSEATRLITQTIQAAMPAMQKHISKAQLGSIAKHGMLRHKR